MEWPLANQLSRATADTPRPPPATCTQVTCDPHLLTAARCGLEEGIYGSEGLPFQMTESLRFQEHLSPFP